MSDCKYDRVDSLFQFALVWIIFYLCFWSCIKTDDMKGQLDRIEKAVQSR